MFRWMKDRDKDDKKKKEKKEKKDKKQGSNESALTQDDMKRLKVLQRNYRGEMYAQHRASMGSVNTNNSSSDKDSLSRRSVEEAMLTNSDSSEYSLSSAARSPDSSPSGGSTNQFDQAKPSTPKKRSPPPVPKKPKGLGTRTNSASVSSTDGPIRQPVDLPPKNPAKVPKPLLLSPVSPTYSISSDITTPGTLEAPGEHVGLGIHLRAYGTNLKLPSVTALPFPKSRVLTIHRQPTGDFGFSLRRATVADQRVGDNTDWKQAIIFAEPSSLDRASDTGLLPGDRLLEVNGVSVEEKSREDIIELIKSSGDSVTLKVQPVPELRELTLRAAVERQELGFDDGMKSFPGGVKSSYKKVAKTDEQLATEQAWLQLNKVWVVHKSGYTGGSILSQSDPKRPPPAEGRVLVRLDFSEEVLEVEDEDVEKANLPRYNHTENLVDLQHVNECSILHTLRQRFASEFIHTYAGNTLLVINPVQPLAVYSEKIMRMFRRCKAEDLPPHIYSMAQTAYNTLLTTRRDQSILLIGRSGSGKSTNFKQLLHYLVVTPGSVNNILTVDKLNAVHALLEAFGACRTTMNSNATRFTQLFSIDYDHSGQVVSASIQAFMLERSRVCRRPEGEPSFHIFRLLLLGANESLRKELYLDNILEQNMFILPPEKSEDYQQAGLSWAYIMAACQILGLPDKEVKAIWCVLAAIYHLGIAGASRGPSGRAQFARPQSAQKASALLGISVEDLAKNVFSGESLSLGGPGKLSPRSLDASDALEALHSMMMGLYSEAFSALLMLINRSLSSNGRSMSSILVLDSPGFQNPATCGKQNGATLEDLCHNYTQERWQMLFHESTFLAQQERYAQENIPWDIEEFHISSPAPLIDIIDHPPQQGTLRSSSADLRELDQRGLLWLLDEESLFPGASEQSFLERLFVHCSKRGNHRLLRKGPLLHQFTVQHLMGTNPVVYNTTGWLRSCREHPVSRQASPLLQDSQKDFISQLFVACRGPSQGASTVVSESSSTLRRSSSIRRAQNVAAVGVKRRSLPLQVKYTVDGIVDLFRRTQLHFVHCFLPRHDAGLIEFRPMLGKITSCSPPDVGVPLLRSQLRAAQILDAVRVHKQGFPGHMLYSEFRRRFSLLAPSDPQFHNPELDNKKAVEAMLDHLDVDSSSVCLGLSQIFLRSSALAHLEAQREEKLNDVIVHFQAYCRGYVARNKLKKLKVQDMAIRCIQRNVRKFLAIRSWPWWRLLVKILPLLNVHRTEEELRMKTEEVELLRAKVEKLEKDRNELKQSNDKLEAKVSELRADLAEEQATLTHTAEMLEAETSERMKLEKEVQNLQAECAQMRQQTDRMEMDMMETRMFHNAELNGDLSDEDDLEAAGSIYRQKYERLVRELELTKRRLQQKHEEEMEQHILAKKAVDKRLADALEDLEEEKQFASQWKRKAQKLTAEMQDLRLLLQENMNRNSDLEKKQRRFDAELSSAQEEARKEKFNRERLQREKELALAEKYAVEQELQSCRMDMDLQSEKIAQLNRELEELTLSSHGEEEVTQLKRTKQELERKLKDQEEELEELAGQVSLLEQAKLRLEMSLEKSRQESRREISVREEEMEELRASFSKKLKNLEAQLEAEQEDRHQLVRQKHELERRILEMSEQPPPRDPEIERRLRRDLKRTKALLRDAQSMLEHTRNGQANKTLIRQLKNQVEDAEFAKTAAIKARQGAELELQDIQAQLEEVLRVKNEAESRCLQLSREKSSLQTQLEEMEEEQSEIMKKYKAVVQQMSSDQKLLTDQSSQISDLEAEKQSLRDQITDLTAKLESLMGNSVDTGVQRRLEARVKELESRLDLEQSHRSRLENQVTRLKEQSDRLLEESENLRSKEQQAQEACKRVQRQLRELREDYALLKQKEAEALQKQHELQMALENSAADLQATKNDLRLACQRIQDLQSALEEDIDSDTDIGDEESDSDSSTEVSSILSKSLSPTYRLNRLSTSTSEASLDLGLQCSRTSSFSHDLPSSRFDVDADDARSLPHIVDQPLDTRIQTSSENQLETV